MDSSCVITVPSTFRAMLRGSHERRAWRDSLPERVDQQCRAWNLSLDGDPWHGSNSLVLPVRRRGEQFALRLTAPDESFPAEVAALRFWDGRGTVLLVETDLGAGTMLLERLDPTRSPATLPLAEANHHALRIIFAAASPASRVLSTGELVRDRLATLTSELGRAGPSGAGRNAGRCLYRRRDPDLRHRRPCRRRRAAPRAGARGGAGTLAHRQSLATGLLRQHAAVLRGELTGTRADELLTDVGSRRVASADLDAIAKDLESWAERDWGAGIDIGPEREHLDGPLPPFPGPTAG